LIGSFAGLGADFAASGAGFGALAAAFATGSLATLLGLLGLGEAGDEPLLAAFAF
jgi:hypothetical protein